MSPNLSDTVSSSVTADNAFFLPELLWWLRKTRHIKRISSSLSFFLWAQQMLVVCVVGSVELPLGFTISVINRNHPCVSDLDPLGGLESFFLLPTGEAFSVHSLLLDVCPFRLRRGWGNGMHPLHISKPKLVAAVSCCASLKRASWEMTSCSHGAVAAGGTTPGCVVCWVRTLRTTEHWMMLVYTFFSV